jgi:hypothetical protein
MQKDEPFLSHLENGNDALDFHLNFFAIWVHLCQISVYRERVKDKALMTLDCSGVIWLFFTINDQFCIMFAE